MPAITECAVAAFTTFEVFGPSWYSDAGVLPALLAANHRVGLSRVAVGEGGVIIGHAQWNLGLMFLAGRWREAAWLAPLSVHPAHQHLGVGSALMHDGIQLLRERGVEILVILGHDQYYPRFRLLTGCLGRHGLTIPMPAPLASDPEGYRLRPVACGDETVCRALWQELCGATEGAVEPGPGLLPWISGTKDIMACCLERGGKAVGHARFDQRAGSDAGHGLLRFLAADAEAASILAARITAWAGWIGERLFVPLPPAAPAVGRLFVDTGSEPMHEWWPAGMAMALQESAPGSGAAGPLTAVLRSCQAKEQAPLFVEWSPLFDF